MRGGAVLAVGVAIGLTLPVLVAPERPAVAAAASEGIAPTTTTDTTQSFPGGLTVTLSQESWPTGWPQANANKWRMGPITASQAWYAKPSITSAAYAPTGVVDEMGMASYVTPASCVGGAPANPAINATAVCSNGGFFKFTFNRPVNNPTLSITDVGGFTDYYFSNGGVSNAPMNGVTSTQVAATLRLTGGVTGMRYLTSQGNFDPATIAVNTITGYEVNRAAWFDVNAVTTVDTGANASTPAPRGTGTLLVPQPTGPTNAGAPETWGTGSGTVQILGTGITEVVFDTTLKWFNANMIDESTSVQDSTKLATMWDWFRTHGDSWGFSWRIDYIPDPAPAPSPGGGGATPALLVASNAYTTTFNTPLAVNAPGVLANDSGSGLAVVSNTKPANGTATVNRNGSFTYTPNPGFIGTDCFTYVVSDSYGQSASASTCVTVPIPPKPTITAGDDTFSTPQNTPLSASVVGNDAYSPGSTFTLMSTPSHGTVTMQPSGDFTYTPDPDYSGSDAFTYQVCAGAPYPEICSTATVTVTVPGPTASTLPGAVLKGVLPGSTDPMTFRPPRNWPTGGSMAIAPTGTGDWGSRVKVPGKGTWEVKGDKVVFTPLPGFTGTTSVDYRTTSPSGESRTSTFTAVAPIVAVDDSSSTQPGKAVSGSVAGNDRFPAGSTFTVSAAPAHGSVTLRPDGTWTYLPAPGFVGTDSFGYRVCAPAPNQNLCDSAMVTIVVPGAGKAAASPATEARRAGTRTPTIFRLTSHAKPSPGARFLGEASAIAPLGVAPRASSTGWSTIVRTPKGTWTLNGSKVAFRPARGFSGTATIRYRMMDSTRQWVFSTLTVNAPKVPGSIHAGVV